MKLALAALAACAAPTGTTQRWPPAFGVTIAAAAFADLDGDGAEDIAIAATGSADGEGLYLVRGGTDWDGATITSFSRFVPHALADVAALHVVGDTLVLAYNIKGVATLETLDLDTLATISTTPLAIASMRQLVIDEVAAADASSHAVIIGDGDVVQLDPAISDAPQTIPPPVPPRWQPEAALGFASGAIAIATPAQIETTSLAPPFTYQAVRPPADTVALVAQIGATLTTTPGAQIAAIVGIDAGGARVCAIDVTATTGAVCFPIAPMPGARFSIVAGQLDADPRTDLAIASNGQIVTILNVALDGTAFTAASVTTTAVALTSPILAIAPAHLFALGIDGQASCIGC